jgi:hypothetical protein
VRTVFADGGLSGPSGKVSFVPLAQGKITITQNYTIDGSGYSFALQKYTKARDFENDIYIFATNSKTGISSPSRMHSSLRETRITLDGNTDLTQPLQNGKTYMLKTADGGLVRLTLLSLSGKPPELKATFNYIYYPPGVSPS